MGAIIMSTDKKRLMRWLPPCVNEVTLKSTIPDAVVSVDEEKVSATFAGKPEVEFRDDRIAVKLKDECSGEDIFAMEILYDECLLKAEEKAKASSLATEKA